MKNRTVLIGCCILLIFLAVPAHAQFPTHLGGFTLGGDIADYPHLIDMATCRDVTFNKYLGEGEVIAPVGFKTGLIAYGKCDRPNKIVRIKLKYEDSSKKFYKKLFKAYKKSLGEPNEYKGDPFQTMIAWKWSFSNDAGERVSLTLQHNVMVEDEKKGTAVKMTLTSQVDRERICYSKRKLRMEKPQKTKVSKKKRWEMFVPH